MHAAGVCITGVVSALPWLLAFGATACGGAPTTTSVAGPSETRCGISLTNDTPELPAAGGNGTITIAAPRECSWSVSSEAPWINPGTTSGQGAASVGYSVLPNPSGVPRRGRLLVAEAAAEVAQAAAPCRYEVAPGTVNVAAAGGQVSIRLSAPDGCRWAARIDVPWIRNVAPFEGAGGATVLLTIASNTAGARAGAVTLGDATVRVNQSGAAGPGPTPPEPSPDPPNPDPPSPAPACTYGVSPARVAVSAAGEQLSIAVAAEAGCRWTATSSAGWIVLASGDTGSGNGSVRIAAQPNTGPGRTGIVRVADRTVTIEQQAAPPAEPTCTYAIRPEYYNAGRGPDEILINVSAESGCRWTAATGAAWVTIESGRSGSGSGAVRLTIPANSGPPRMALVTIAGHTFTLRQQGLCTASIKPTYYNAGRGPDDIRIAVTADAGCEWTAASSVSWVTVAEGTTGSGNGVVRLVTEPNSGATRSVTLTIAGQPFALRQAGAQ